MVKKNPFYYKNCNAFYPQDSMKDVQFQSTGKATSHQKANSQSVLRIPDFYPGSCFFPLFPIGCENVQTFGQLCRKMIDTSPTSLSKAPPASQSFFYYTPKCDKFWLTKRSFLHSQAKWCSYLRYCFILM